ncbi:DUF1998 domain-containing protein [Glycomyces sp. L485]|uniref:DUF1998 domain-containing protein n=1 Tax=Glycomyces sp. L485 TaxID=2909235 RepID=UPI001F4B6381|nr:DUF1998 domain-containing protein [Glycomyces sp. L485]MCH7231597.1 DUF1998 domain-containing protein [Glycomyces sp. L485]
MTSKAPIREVGSARPSHLMFTGGIGAIIDLPNVAALVGGLEDWEPHYRDDNRAVIEPRLLAETRRRLGRSVRELRLVPLSDEDERSAVGVPVQPFPAWLRCTKCNRLNSLHSKFFTYVNSKRGRPDLARFVHRNCGGKTTAKAVPARFLLACRSGHLDEFPYEWFVHKGGSCPKAEHPHLRMDDRAGNRAVNVRIKCESCSAERNLREAMGAAGRDHLPACRGRHPHLRTPANCREELQPLIVGASNLWFPQTVSVLSVPPDDTDRLKGLVAEHAESLQIVENFTAEQIAGLMRSLPELKPFREFDAADLRAAMDAHTPTPSAGNEIPDLLEPEWKAFTAARLPEDAYFTAVREPGGVPARLRPYFTDVVRAERLREVRAFHGFTRLDAPDPEQPDLVPTAPISRGEPTWAPASEVFGEGIFLRIDADALSTWESRIESTPAVQRLRSAWATFRTKRYSGRLQAEFDPSAGWPGAGYVVLHTLSHLLIRTIALECGYNSASLAERIYSNGDDRAGILIYTAVPDAEGTLGGLVSLAEPDRLTRIVRRALTDAQRCSGDPVCADHLPAEPSDSLHGAACHSCLFVSETTCERGNRFLDRRFTVDLGDGLSFFTPWD